MRLQMLTWAESEAALATSDAIIMPIGSTEQHGPNGLIGTDAVTAEAIAVEVGARANALVAPVIAVGMAQHHMAFSGSMTLRPSTLVLVIRDYVASLAHHGFRRFYFINGHGGNIATITTAFSEINADVSLAAPSVGNTGGNTGSNSGSNTGHINCVLRNWWANPAIKALSEKHFGDQEGSHATPSEVALTQYLFPDFIKQAEMDPVDKLQPLIGNAEEYRARYPDGRINSNPALATPEIGAEIFEAAVAHWTEDFRAFAQ